MVRVPQGQRLQLRFDTFNIHSNERGLCEGNYLEIIDGLRSDTVRRLTPRFCGSSKPADHVSSTSVVSLHYVTNTNNTGQSSEGVRKLSLYNYSQPGTGWRALFQIVPETTMSGSVPTGGLTPTHTLT